jgi:peptidyl-prolyl cis-trans isomerase D
MDPVFEESAFSLAAVGDVSAVVKSAFGFHIIKLTGLKAEQITPFNEVKDEIMASVKTEKATEEFYELHQQMAATAFEMPDTLDDVAALINKPVKHTELFERSSAPAPLNNTAAINSAFSDELIQDKVNSEVIELSDDHILVLRASAHEPERTQSLEEVKADITQHLSAQKAQEAARAWADSLLTSLNQGEKAALRNTPAVDPAITEQLFKLAVTDTQDKAIVELGNGDIGLVQLLKINPAEQADATQLVSLQNRLGNNRSQAALENLVGSLKAQADITIHN